MPWTPGRPAAGTAGPALPLVVAVAAALLRAAEPAIVPEAAADAGLPDGELRYGTLGRRAAVGARQRGTDERAVNRTFLDGWRGRLVRRGGY